MKALLRGVNSFELCQAERDHIWSMARRHALDLDKSELGERLKFAMQSQCPVAGEITKFLTVIKKPGQSIPEHQHKRHLIMFYPQACEPIYVRGVPVELEAGMILYLPPLTPHKVLRCKVERLSVAMLVSAVATTRLTRACS